METSWTPERTRLLDELWTAGLSGQLIANQLGGVTRNAVIGKVHRLGLALHAPASKRRAPRLKSPKKEQTEKTRFRLTMHGKHRHITEVIHQEPVVEVIDSEIPDCQRLTFEQLTDRCCKYPVGEVGKPGFFFCGAPVKKKSRYCIPHHQRCHTKERESRWFSFAKLF